MALILSDRVKVNTTTTGTGTVVLGNAATGYQSFAVIGNNNTTYYTIAGQTSDEWEVGIGTYYLANSSLSRDTILSSSAANAAVTFGVGTKDVFVTYPAERSVYSNATSVVSLTDTEFSLSNASDATKQARFNVGNLGTNNTIAYTLPSNATANTAVTLAGLNVIQTFSAAQTFGTNVTQSAGSYTYSSTGANWAATAQTTGTFTVGGLAQTGTIGVGQSNATQITNLANGATIAASTKTLNIGTNGVSGSITNITVGSANGTTVNVLGNLTATLTGGSINNMTIGATTANTGSFTTITASANITLGNSTIQNSVGNLVFTTGGANVTAFSIDPNQVSSFFSSIEEKATISATAAGANVNLDAITQSILYYTSNATANTTINIRGSATVPLNNILANGQSISVVFMSTQGNTAYYVNGYQIDGVGVTPRWQGNSAPTTGNARSIDVYSFTAIKTANATYTVLASQTQFA